VSWERNFAYRLKDIRLFLIILIGASLFIIFAVLGDSKLLESALAVLVPLIFAAIILILVVSYAIRRLEGN
jgi:hypothetical protein